MKNSEVDSVLEQIQKARALVSAPMTSFSLKIQAGVGIAKKQAEEALPLLEKRLMKEILPARAVVVFAQGDEEKINQVGETLRDNCGVFIDLDAWWRPLVREIEESRGPSPKFDVLQYHVMMRGVMERANEVQFDGQPKGEYCDPGMLHTSDDIMRHLRASVQDSFEEALLTCKVRSDILRAVVGFESAAAVPVLVKGALPEEVAVLTPLFSRAERVEIPSDFEVTEPNVGAVFKKQKNTEKAKKKQESQNEQ